MRAPQTQMKLANQATTAIPTYEPQRHHATRFSCSYPGFDQRTEGVRVPPITCSASQLAPEGEKIWARCFFIVPPISSPLFASPGAVLVCVALALSLFVLRPFVLLALTRTGLLSSAGLRPITAATKRAPAPDMSTPGQNSRLLICFHAPGRRENHDRPASGSEIVSCREAGLCSASPTQTRSKLINTHFSVVNCLSSSSHLRLSLTSFSCSLLSQELSFFGPASGTGTDAEKSSIGPKRPFLFCKAESQRQRCIKGRCTERGPHALCCTNQQRLGPSTRSCTLMHGDPMQLFL
ncbi:hypothetical protein GGI35DRAFT_65552 [Trichoderma velutinum]